MSDKILTIQSIRKIVAVGVMVVMSACSDLRPNARILDQAPGAAPVVYKQGWKDGCESGMAIAGNQLYKAVYQNKINPQMVNNVQYYRGWNEAKLYCAHYTMATLWEAGTLPTTPTEDNGILPDMPKGIFSVAASWGTPSLINWNGTDQQEDEGLGFAGFYRN